MSETSTPPPPQTPARSTASRLSGRSRSREFALQALYQSIVGKNDMSSVDAFTRDLVGFHKCDVQHYDALIYGCVRELTNLNELLSPCLDRAWEEISPIEKAVLWMGTYEYLFCIETPWRVILNEYIELDKRFGGTDSHKYINGVLHKLGVRLRAAEIKHAQNVERISPSRKGMPHES